MDLRSLRYFVAALEEGSISAAATRMHIAQPSISVAVAKLESQLDTQLLVRGRQGVHATRDGEILYQQAKSLLQHAQAITHLFETDEKQPSIEINVSPTVSLHHLGVLMALIQGHFPKLQCRIKRDSISADIHILPEYQVAPESIFIPMAQESYQLIIPKNNVLSFAETLRLEDLQGERFIMRSFCERNQELIAFLESTNTKLETVAEVDNEEWAMMLVEQGLGCSILPISRAGTHQRNFVGRSLQTTLGDIALERTVGIAMDYTLTQQPRMQALIDILRQQPWPA